MGFKGISEFLIKVNRAKWFVQSLKVKFIYRLNFTTKSSEIIHIILIKSSKWFFFFVGIYPNIILYEENVFNVFGVINEFPYLHFWHGNLHAQAHEATDCEYEQVKIYRFREDLNVINAKSGSTLGSKGFRSFHSPWISLIEKEKQFADIFIHIHLPSLSIKVMHEL